MSNYFAPLRYRDGVDSYTVVDPRYTPGAGGSYVSLADFGGSGNDLDDNTAAFNAAIADLNSTGGTLFIPPGVYRFASAPNPVPGGITLLGTGIGWNAPWDGAAGGAPHRASVLKAAAVMPQVVQLGTNSAENTPAAGAGASMRNVSVYGAGLAQSAVRTAGRRNYVRDCEIVGGSQVALSLAGQNSHMIGGVAGNLNVGTVVEVGTDGKVYDAQIREAGPGGALVMASGDNTMIQRNHLYHGTNSLAAINVEAWNGNNWGCQIVGNTIEECGTHEIRLRTGDVVGGAGGGSLSGVIIAANYGYTRTTGIAFIDAPGQGLLTDVTVTGNHIQGQSDASPYTSLVRFGASSGADRWVVTGNVGRSVSALFEGTVPAGVRHFGNVFATTSAGTTINRSDNDGRATFAGTGSLPVFTIAHGLGAEPRTISVTPGSAAAATDYYATSDATNITVTYVTAPASGATVVLNWQAAR